MNESLHILIVDDENAVRNLLGLILQDQECIVDQAGGGHEALAKLAAASYDLVLLDLIMPEIGGTDILRHIRGQCPETDVIMISGQDAEEAIEEVLELGALAYITKPFSEKTVRKVIDQYRQMRVRAE